MNEVAMTTSSLSSSPLTISAAADIHQGPTASAAQGAKSGQRFSIEAHEMQNILTLQDTLERNRRFIAAFTQALQTDQEFQVLPRVSLWRNQAAPAKDTTLTIENPHNEANNGLSFIERTIDPSERIAPTTIVALINNSIMTQISNCTFPLLGLDLSSLIVSYLPTTMYVDAHDVQLPRPMWDWRAELSPRSGKPRPVPLPDTTLYDLMNPPATIATDTSATPSQSFTMRNVVVLVAKDLSVTALNSCINHEMDITLDWTLFCEINGYYYPKKSIETLARGDNYITAHSLQYNRIWNKVQIGATGEISTTGATTVVLWPSRMPTKQTASPATESASSSSTSQQVPVATVDMPSRGEIIRLHLIQAAVPDTQAEFEELTQRLAHTVIDRTIQPPQFLSRLYMNKQCDPEK